MSSKSENKVTAIPLTQIVDFPDHPYQVRDDESMNELVESIKERGLIQPVLVRPIENGMYEMVSGHRRKRAFELAGIETIPARVKELSRDEAILAMVDSNLQREKILPSEKAKAYKMRLDAMKRQAGRPKKENLVPVGLNYSREALSRQTGESETQIQRYIRLNELVPEILTLVDEGRIAMRPAVEISYFPKETQQQLFEAIKYNDCTPSHDQAIRMRKALNEGRLTKEVVDTIMDEDKPNQRVKSPFRDKRIGQLIPKSIPFDKQCDYVLRALDFYNKYRQKKREQAR
ncbi:MAG: ParB/RepB/Spo0J family partition protein [Ruminococcus sp.]|nr:ParB/RepB/Spo0J family partition protein [Ruminococcus sp.]